MKLEIYRIMYPDVTTRNITYRYNLIADNHYICCVTMTDQNRDDSLAASKILTYFEDHINEMFNLSDKPIVNEQYKDESFKLGELTYTESEMKQLRVNKKIEEINKDF